MVGMKSMNESQILSFIKKKKEKESFCCERKKKKLKGFRGKGVSEIFVFHFQGKKRKAKGKAKIGKLCCFLHFLFLSFSFFLSEPKWTLCSRFSSFPSLSSSLFLQFIPIFIIFTIALFLLPHPLCRSSRCCSESLKCHSHN